jgi:predicted MFS family arabinose efflux permease
VVERENLQPANALLSLAQSGAYGLGGAAAGIIVALAGAEWAIATDAGTFVVSALLIAQLKPRAQQRSERQNLLRDIIDGWKEFTSHRWLWTIVAQWSLMLAGWSGCFFVVGPIVAERSLGGPGAWGWIAGAFGAGLVLGGLLGIRLAVRRPMLVGTLGVLCLTLPVALLALAAPVPWIAAGAFVAGTGLELFGVLWFTALHTHVAPEALSRVSAYDILGSIALAPIGQAAAGPLIDWIGAPRTLWLGVALIAIPTLLVLGVREVRELESS